MSGLRSKEEVCGRYEYRITLFIFYDLKMRLRRYVLTDQLLGRSSGVSGVLNN